MKKTIQFSCTQVTFSFDQSELQDLRHRKTCLSYLLPHNTWTLGRELQVDRLECFIFCVNRECVSILCVLVAFLYLFCF